MEVFKRRRDLHVVGSDANDIGLRARENTNGMER